VITTRTAILGGGVAGLATAWALCDNGANDCVLLEREPALGRVSSRLNAAILRTLTPDPLVSSFARESAAFLSRPPTAFARLPLVDPCGLLLAAEGDAATELERQAHECTAGPECAPVSAAAARALAPHFDAPAGTRLWFVNEGRLENDRLLAAYAQAARASGADLRTSCAIDRIERLSGGFVLHSRGAPRVRCEVLVLAAGAWAARLGATLGSRVPLHATERHLAVTRAARGVAARAPVVWTGSDPFYARVEGDGLLLSPCDENPVDPDRHPAQPTLRAELARKCAHWLPRVEPGVLAHYWSGLRTFTRDGERFCIGWDPDVAGLFWVAGLAGHGMTCSAAIGRLAAGLLRRDSCGVYGSSGAFARAFDPRRLLEPAASPIE
jgi:D-arginine dehydrogenase